jgi:hypothetical protein
MKSGAESRHDKIVKRFLLRRLHLVFFPDVDYLLIVQSAGKPRDRGPVAGERLNDGFA